MEPETLCQTPMPPIANFDLPIFETTAPMTSNKPVKTTETMPTLWTTSGPTATIVSAAEKLTIDDCLSGLPVAVAERFRFMSGNWRSASEASGSLEASFWAPNPLKEGYPNARVFPKNEVMIRAVAIYLLEGGEDVESVIGNLRKNSAPEGAGDGLARHALSPLKASAPTATPERLLSAIPKRGQCSLCHNEAVHYDSGSAGHCLSHWHGTELSPGMKCAERYCKDGAEYWVKGTTVVEAPEKSKRCRQDAIYTFRPGTHKSHQTLRASLLPIRSGMPKAKLWEFEDVFVRPDYSTYQGVQLSVSSEDLADDRAELEELDGPVAADE